MLTVAIPKIETKYFISDFMSKYALFFVIACIFHQFLFCLINTHFFHISRVMIIAFEFTLLLATSFLFITRLNINVLALILFIFANCFFLAMFKSGFDPKHIRNFLIPVLAIWLGANASRKYDWDRVVIYIGLVIVAVGMFEGLFSSVYQKIVNILDYQVTLGMADENVAKYMDSNYGLNGIRVWGRNFFGFLFGAHRISSVFLESASMTNVGVIIAIWGLAKGKLKEMLPFLLIGIVMVILSDSRFGSTILAMLIVMRLLFSIHLLTIVGFFMPLIVIASSFLIYSFLYDEYGDNFIGRIGLTAKFISNFELLEFFGAYPVHYSSFLDSGYAFILHHYGIVFVIVIWLSFLYLKMNSYEGVRYKALIASTISANFAIGGDAFYALKLSGLMWFLMGLLTQYSYLEQSYNNE